MRGAATSRPPSHEHMGPSDHVHVHGVQLHSDVSKCVVSNTRVSPRTEAIISRERVQNVRAPYKMYAQKCTGPSRPSASLLRRADLTLEVRVQITKALPQHPREEKIPGGDLAQSTV